MILMLPLAEAGKTGTGGRPTRLYSVAAGGIVVLGVVLLAVGGYLWWQQSRALAAAQPVLTIEDPDRAIDAPVAGQKQDVEFRIVNPSDQTRRVVGAVLTCGTTACFAPKQPIPFEIPPKGSAAIVFSLDLREPGPFELEVPLYLEDAGLRQLTVKVTGNALPAAPAKK
jgi:hypothetical protein